MGQGECREGWTGEAGDGPEGRGGGQLADGGAPKDRELGQRVTSGAVTGSFPGTAVGPPEAAACTARWVVWAREGNFRK